jgi:hypothetical protein
MLIRILSVTVLLYFIGLSAGAADSLDQSRRIVTKTNQKLQASQEKIDRADDKAVQMLAEYKTLEKEIENYRVYNGQLQEIVDSQLEEMRLLDNDIDKIEATGLQVMPFMQKMIDGLERFIASDYPFLPEERRMRLAHLNANMKRADLSIAAKYRQILEAYQIEIDYGNTLEAYEGDLEGKRVVFLKIGRIGFYYLSLDRQHCGAWHAEQQTWQALTDMDYKISIAKAIKIAKKQRAPDLFFAAVAPARSRQ